MDELKEKLRQYLAKVYQTRYGLVLLVITVGVIFSLPFKTVTAKPEKVTTFAKPKKQKIKKKPIKLAAASPSIDKLTSKTPEYVILQPIDEATFSSETTASVASIPVKEGNYFKKGDVLLELDCRVQQAELQQALAKKQSAEMAMKSAQRLKSYGSISEFELVKAKTEAQVAEAEASKLMAVVDKCVIEAPFNGAVANVMVHAFETVKPGDPLMKIVSTENIIVELEVPSGWLGWMKVGDVFDVYINEIDKTIPTTITRINPAIEPISQTVKIVGEVSDSKYQLLPGMSGQATFPKNPDNALGRSENRVGNQIEKSSI